MKWTWTWKLNNPKEGRGGRLHPPEQEACLSLLSQQFLEVFRRERAAFGASIHHRSTSPPPPPRLLYLWVTHFKPGPRWLSPGREGEGDGCQVAKMQKKSGCGRGLPLRRGRSDVCRLEDFLRGERERERGSRHFIDPWNRSTTKILSNTSSTG